MIKAPCKTVYQPPVQIREEQKLNALHFAENQKAAQDAAVTIQRHVRRWLRSRAPVPSLLTTLVDIAAERSHPDVASLEDSVAELAGGTLADRIRQGQEEHFTSSVETQAELQRRERRKKRERKLHFAAHQCEMLDRVSQMQKALRKGSAAATVVRTSRSAAAHHCPLLTDVRRYGDGRPQTSPAVANLSRQTPPGIALDAQNKSMPLEERQQGLVKAIGYHDLMVWSACNARVTGQQPRAIKPVDAWKGCRNAHDSIGAAEFRKGCTKSNPVETKRTSSCSLVTSPCVQDGTRPRRMYHGDSMTEHNLGTIHRCHNDGYKCRGNDLHPPSCSWHASSEALPGENQLWQSAFRSEQRLASSDLMDRNMCAVNDGGRDAQVQLCRFASAGGPEICPEASESRGLKGAAIEGGVLQETASGFHECAFTSVFSASPEARGDQGLAKHTAQELTTSKLRLQESCTTLEARRARISTSATMRTGSKQARLLHSPSKPVACRPASSLGLRWHARMDLDSERNICAAKGRWQSAMCSEQHLVSTELKERSNVVVNDDCDAQMQLIRLATARGPKPCTEAPGCNGLADEVIEDRTRQGMAPGFHESGWNSVSSAGPVKTEDHRRAKHAAQVLVASQAGESLAAMGTCMRKLVGLYQAVWRHPMTRHVDERDWTTRCRLNAQGTPNPGDVCRPLKGRVVQSARDLSALHPELDQHQSPTMWDHHIVNLPRQQGTIKPNHLSTNLLGKTGGWTTHGLVQISNGGNQTALEIRGCNTAQKHQGKLDAQGQDENYCSEFESGREHDGGYDGPENAVSQSMHDLDSSALHINQDTPCQALETSVMEEAPGQRCPPATNPPLSTDCQGSRNAKYSARSASTTSILCSLDNQAHRVGVRSCLGWAEQLKHR
jgi:hypothetical protein